MTDYSEKKLLSWNLQEKNGNRGMAPPSALTAPGIFDLGLDLAALRESLKLELLSFWSSWGDM